MQIGCEAKFVHSAAAEVRQLKICSRASTVMELVRSMRHMITRAFQNMTPHSHTLTFIKLSTWGVQSAKGREKSFDQMERSAPDVMGKV
jgi:hypothetical protein